MPIEWRETAAVGTVNLGVGYDPEAHEMVVRVPLLQEREALTQIAGQAVYSIPYWWLSGNVITGSGHFFRYEPPSPSKIPDLTECRVHVRLNPSCDADDALNQYCTTVPTAIGIYQRDHSGWNPPQEAERDVKIAGPGDIAAFTASPPFSAGGTSPPLPAARRRPLSASSPSRADMERFLRRFWEMLDNPEMRELLPIRDERFNMMGALLGHLEYIVALRPAHSSSEGPQIENIGFKIRRTEEPSPTGDSPSLSDKIRMAIVRAYENRGNYPADEISGVTREPLQVMRNPAQEARIVEILAPLAEALVTDPFIQRNERFWLRILNNVVSNFTLRDINELNYEIYLRDAMRRAARDGLPGSPPPAGLL